MSGRGTGLVSVGAETLEEAHEIAGRLTQAGFARPGIKVIRRAEDLYEVSLQVRDADRAKAEAAIANRLGGRSASPLSGTALALGLAAGLLGAGIYAALTARKLVPRYLRDGGQEPAAAPLEE